MAQQTRHSDEMVYYYWQVYQKVYGREPKAYYVGNGWYYVNGQAVHSHTFEREIAYLYDLAKKISLRKEKETAQVQKGAIRRIIGKLRLL
jgi:hypothetical protein